MVKKMRGKCPRCCPDGGACFTIEHEYTEDGKWQRHKKCSNCNLMIPIRKIKPSGKPTLNQQKIIDKIVGLFGGIPEITMHGRDVWLSLKNYEGRHLFDGQSLYGTISVNGRYQITLQRLFGDEKITDDIGIDVYLTKRLRTTNDKVAKNHS
jgi:hypothetical protein